MKLNKVDKSFFINLDRRVDRLDHINKNLPFDSDRFSAIDAVNLKLNEKVEKLFHQSLDKLTKAEIACALSHYKLWKKLTKDESSENYLILEDDVVFKDGFVELWNESYSNNIPKNYGLVYLGGCQPWNQGSYSKVLASYNEHFYTVKKNDFFTKGDHFWHMTTCSYLISKTAAEFLCLYAEKFGLKMAVDIFMLTSLPHQYIYHLNPLMAHQLHEEGNNVKPDTKSDIRNSNDKFTDSLIPKIIHQSWKTNDIPHDIYKKEWIDSWLKKNPDWEYKLWTDEDNRNLIKEHYPQYLDLYDSYQTGVSKADIARYFYMHKYGGVYVDLDFKCLKPLDELLNGEVILLGKQKMKKSGGEIEKNVIPNAFKYSIPEQKFWLDCIDLLPESKYNEEGIHNNPEYATGPIFLFKCLERLKPKNVKIVDPEILYPISWQLDGSAAKDSVKDEWYLDPEKCFPEAYAITYWTGAWMRDSAVHRIEKSKKISVVIPTIWMANRYLMQSLIDLDKSEYVCEVILINNKPSETPSWIKSFNKIKVLDQDANLYFNGSVNLASTLCKSEICCVFNDDIEVDLEIFKFVLDSYDDKTGCMFISPKNINSQTSTKKNLEPLSGWLPNGAGQLFFFNNQHFRPIPTELRHHFGDNFINRYFRKMGFQNYTIEGFALKTPTSVSQSAAWPVIKEDWSIYKRFFDMPTDHIDPNLEPSVFNNLKSKQESFMQLASMWPNFLHKPESGTKKTLPVVDWLTYCDKNISHPQPEKSQFSCYNGGKEIAIVMMYTPNIYDFAVYSEKSIKQYAEHQGYTLYVYRDNLNKSQHPNWSKPQALLNHIGGHSHIIWMDSDTLIFNPEKKFSDIINKYPRKFIIACKDIGGKNGSLFNSGVLIFKNHQYVKNLITRWRDFDCDKSSLYSSGGDQEVLCGIVKRSDSFGFNSKILPFDAFNTDPRLVTKDTFILHFMAYPQPLKRIFMSYWHSK